MGQRKGQRNGVVGESPTANVRARNVAALAAGILAASTFLLWSVGISVMISTGHTKYVEFVSYCCVGLVIVFSVLGLALVTGFAHFVLEVTRSGIRFLLTKTEQNDYREDFRGKLKDGSPRQLKKRAKKSKSRD